MVAGWRSIVFSSNRDGPFNLYQKPAGGGKEEVLLFKSGEDKYATSWSPDGHSEVYVRAFSANPDGTVAEPGGKWQISSEGGTGPRWRTDGRELLYQVPSGVMAVEIAIGPPFRAGKHTLIKLMEMTPGASWVSSGDGARFLTSVPRSGPRPYTVVVNWQAGLKK